MLEILVALVVFGLLLAGLAQATRFGLAATGQQARMVDRYAGLDAVDRLLRHLIEQVDPDGQPDAPSFRGTSTSLAFTSEMPRAIAMPNHHADMRLLVDDAHRLVLRWTPAFHANRVGSPATPTDTVLLTGVNHLALAYWPRPSTAGAGWQSSWNAPLPPALVRIRVVFAGTDPPVWPDIVAATLRGR